MSETPATPAILAAVWNVMKTVRGVAKNGQMNGPQRYSFRQYDDMADALGDAFREHGIFMQTETISREYVTVEVANNNGGKTIWTTCRIAKRFLFTSLLDGSTLKAEAFGEGRDNSDKATSKAETMATKSALAEAFMLATKDADPDAERPEIVQPGNGKPASKAKPTGNAKANGQQDKALVGSLKNEILTLGKKVGKGLPGIKADFTDKYGKDFFKATAEELQEYRKTIEALAEMGAHQTHEDAAQAVADIEAQATGAAA